MKYLLIYAAYDKMENTQACPQNLLLDDGTEINRYTYQYLFIYRAIFRH